MNAHPPLIGFSRDERIVFERSTLLPRAGLESEELDRYCHYIDLIHTLNYARNEVARQYLYQGLSREDAIRWLMEFGLENRGTATQRLNFIATLRTYVINYNFGQDLVAVYINGRAGDDRNARWEIYEEILTNPLAPNDIIEITP